MLNAASDWLTMTASFRNPIQTELRRRGWSRYRLAKQSGLPMRSVMAYLAGERDMAGERVAVLGAVLGLKLGARRDRKRR